MDSEVPIESVLLTMISISSKAGNNIYKIFMVGMMLMLENFMSFEERFPTEWVNHKFRFFLIMVGFTFIQPIIDGFTLFLLDYLYKFNILDYLMYCNYRFMNRKDHWVLNSYIIDISLDIKYRSLDVLCFSDQFYFIVTLESWGIIFNILAMHIMTLNSYNGFNDPFSLVFIPIGVIMYKLLRPLGNLCQNISKVWQKKKKRDSKQFNLHLNLEGYMMSNIHKY